MTYPSYSDRAKNAKNPVAQRLLELMETKKTNLCVSADLTKAAEILALAEAVGEEICVLKTHVDIIEDFTPDFPVQLRAIADRKNFLIFEDRKFADIGNTVAMQFAGGIYKIAEWADIVNVHALTSYVDLPIISGLCIAKKRDVGILLLAQMTPLQMPEKEFFNREYAMKTFDYAIASRNFEMHDMNRSLVLGFIGSAEQPEILGELSDHRFTEAPEMLIMTPGIQLSKNGGKDGQTYNTPEKAISNGSDVIIVGRGIYQADDQKTAARIYKEAGWAAYEARCA